MYPISLDIEDKPVLLIGGGRVAEQKVRSLLTEGALVTLIAPEVSPELARLAEMGEYEWIRREYRTGDMNKYFLVICACGEDELCRAVSEEAFSLSKLINVCDRKELGNFDSVSVLRRGPLTLTFSTDGRSPALSRALRRKFERELPPEAALFPELLERIRRDAGKILPTHQDRVRFWRKTMTAELVDLGLTGDPEALEEVEKRIRDALRAEAEQWEGGRR